MSIRFFITPYKPVDWEISTSDLQIDVDQFAKAFLETWEKAELTRTPKGGLLWKLYEVNEKFSFFGGLQSNLQIVSFEPGDWTTFKDFIFWYRKFIPVRYQLYFFNSSSWNSLEIKETTTIEEIEDFISGET